MATIDSSAEKITETRKDMAEKAQSRVQEAIKSFVDSIDKSHIRQMDKSMHECAANCLSDREAPIEMVHGCISRCQEKTVRAQKYVQTELEQFQAALHRCVLSCQDEVRDKLTPNAPEATIQKLQGEFEVCAINCCDKNIAKLPSLGEKIRNQLNSGRY